MKDFDLKQLIEYFFTDVYKNLCVQIFSELEECINKSKFIEEENKVKCDKTQKIFRLTKIIQQALNLAKDRNKNLSEENSNLTEKLKEKIEFISKDYEKFLQSVDRSDIEIDKARMEESNEILEILQKINDSLNEFKNKG